MHRIRVISRPVALPVLAAALLAVVAWLTGSAPQQDWAFAGAPPPPYVSCANMYLDLPPLQLKGSPPGAEDTTSAGETISRGEPTQSGLPEEMDVTSITYLGPDLDGDGTVDAPPSELCQIKSTEALTAPENGRLHNRIYYQMVPNTRPTVTAQLVEKLVGEPPELLPNLEYTTCGFSETLGTWVRRDVNVVLREQGPHAKNFGDGVLYVDAGHPDCDVSGSTPYVDAYPFVIESHSRDASTDHPETAFNAERIAAGDLVIDPDGPSPKVKGEKQLPDGDDGLADDWDGDGCPDWDELDPYVGEAGELAYANGLDPFNPHDCNMSVNIGGTYRIRATADPAGKGPDGTLLRGAYLRCIGDMQQDGNDLEMRLYCYIDSPTIPVNPEAQDDCVADPEACGDGLANLPPPPPYGDVDDVHSVLRGSLTTPANTIDLSGCQEDRDGQSAEGNVYLVTSQNAHSGRGTADVWIAQTTEDCTGGTPVGDPTFDDIPITMVKVSEKGPCAKDEPGCDAGGLHDFDGDDCPDKNELSDNQQQGGLRDPYNRWDYMNPTRDGQNRVDDILATVNQYFIDKGNPSYTKQTDRTAVIGANPWNLGPPNGQQRVDDILASVKSYFHDCSGGSFDDPDDEPKVE